MISVKQRKILAFGRTQYDALICDGAVRSGKTSIMMIAFVDWAMQKFDGQLFGICGKTVDSAVKNVVIPYISLSYTKEHYSVRWRRMDKVLEVQQGSRINRFEVFGGRDEASFMLVQGRTFAGCLLDEVVLQPESFVQQALARCSVDGSKLWFSCNPSSPTHWFYKTWILGAKERNAYYIHFTMRDNPSLSEKTLARYESMYSGVFYQRYILGQWVAAEGVVYDCFSQEKNVYSVRPSCVNETTSAKTIAIDYGMQNPTRFLEIWDTGETVYVDKEYSWDGRAEMRQKTDGEYAEDLLAFLGEAWCSIIVDPSAASFIAELRRRGLYVIPADNAVLDGIRRVSALLSRGEIRISSDCKELLNEFGNYVWDKNASLYGDERPVKQFDHSLDALRYFVNSLPDWRFGNG